MGREANAVNRRLIELNKTFGFRIIRRRTASYYEDPPEEIPDPNLRELQRKYFGELKRITEAAAAHSFPYHFYFSRGLWCKLEPTERSVKLRLVE